MEEIAEGFGRFIFRMIKWIIIEALMEVVLYWYGRATLKILTFGRYPASSDEAEGRCVITGIIAVIVTIAALAYFL